MKFIFLLLAILAILESEGQKNSINIPNGKSILIDGKITENEWNDSKKIQCTDSIYLFLKSSEEYILIAIQAPPEKNAIVDLYCTNSKQLLNLHASAKLGQRTFIGKIWTPWVWWNNNYWAANVSRVESFDKRTFLKENVREFQIHKSFFTEKRTNLFFEITFIKDGGNINKISFPKDQKNTSPKNWININWD